MTADLQVIGEGAMCSVYLLHPNTEQGQAWLDENLSPEPWQMVAQAVAVESGYIAAIVEGAQADGLTVE